MVNVHPGDPMTGATRTSGPIPPDKPFPTGTQYESYYGIGAVNGRFPDPSSEEGAMWGYLFAQMGFDTTNIEDRRVWVEKYQFIQ